MQKQVSKSHYEFSRYVDKRRWSSMWYQLNEVMALRPGRVLEVGPGPGLFKALASAVGVAVETLDLDPELHPDHVASVLDMPFEGGAFDMVVAFQVLEHLPFDRSLEAFAEITRVAKKGVVISLPESRRAIVFNTVLPRFGERSAILSLPRLFAPRHKFDGEHYWEIGKRGYSLRRIVHELRQPGWELTRTYRVPLNPYHRFFVYAPA